MCLYIIFLQKRIKARISNKFLKRGRAVNFICPRRLNSKCDPVDNDQKYISVIDNIYENIFEHLFCI